MNLVNILGTIATGTSLILIFWGFPDQIWKNYKRKSFEGMSSVLIITALITYLFWGSYAWARGDTFLKIAQTTGFFFCLILVIQIYLYKPPTKKKQQLQTQLEMLQKRNNEVGENEWRNTQILFIRKELEI
ncbi:MAG: SemiSWEET family transporter [Candidatus Paceibacterota bacterium]